MSTDSQETHPVTVHILDKEYPIACEAGEQEELLASAQLVDKRMREIRQSGRVIGTDRIAVLVALNIAHELLQIRRVQDREDDSMGQRLRSLQKKIELALVDTGDGPA